MSDMLNNILLQVENLQKLFPVRKGFFKKTASYVHAVNNISFSIPQGKTLGLVGESGSGKTTTGRMILRAMDPTQGRILFRKDGSVIDIAKLDKKQLKDIRTDIQMIFQDPHSSLNPRMPVFELIAEPLKAHGWSNKACLERVAHLLEIVSLKPDDMKRFPHAFSGGQRQRIGISRALALSPSLVVADEPVSALDVSVQAQILNLLKELQHDFNLTYLFIAHDLSVIRYICDRVAVMYAGNLVEIADRHELFADPRHPYTQTLIKAAPPPNPHEEWLPENEIGQKEMMQAPKAGCPFAPRCQFAENMCWNSVPELEELSAAGSHQISCHVFGDKKH